MMLSLLSLLLKLPRFEKATWFTSDQIDLSLWGDVTCLLFPPPPIRPSASCGIDSQPIRARGIVVNHITQRSTLQFSLSLFYRLSDLQ